MHPVAHVFADDGLTVAHPYFRPEGFVWDNDDGGSYADPDAQTDHNRTVEWSHPIGAIVTALARAGLRIDLLHEHESNVAIGWPFLERDPEERLLPAARGPPVAPAHVLPPRHRTGMRRPAAFAFWGSLGALAYAQAGYPLLLATIARVRGRRGRGAAVPLRPGAGGDRRSPSSPSSSPPTARRT